jgi:arabinofuranan 3-O-arabinosyltransferase
VLDPGRIGRGSYGGVRVDVQRPSWLVLGESYNRGWRAECGGRSLGPPRVVDGFANGWRVSPDCRAVSFALAPQRAVDWGYAVGALACLVLLAVVLLGLRLRRRSRAAAVVTTPPAPIEVDDRPWRLPARRALLAGVAAAVVFGFAFALRAGVVIGPVVALAMWRGVSARVLITVAGALLAIVVPALYLLFPGTDRGGYDTAYPVQHLGAHWVAVGAIVMLVLALARTLAQSLNRASRSSRGRAAAAPAAPAPRSRA